MIHRFFMPFFGGVCLDPGIQASSRVFNYVLRIFTEGDVALPSQGMAAIVKQLGEQLPLDRIRTAARVGTIDARYVALASGEKIPCRAVVLATEGPETARLLGKPAWVDSLGELCLYFAAREAPIDGRYLLLNGEGSGRINSVTIPSIVAKTYAPTDQELISVVLIGDLNLEDGEAESIVRKELTMWFGPVVDDWRHLKTYRIGHALPVQPPPMPDPTVPIAPAKPSIHICGEYGSVPGIQWAMLSGRHAAESVLKDLGR